MPAGVSADLTEAQLKAAIEAAGFYEYTINDFSNSGTQVHVNFTVNSKDTNKEMDNVKINLPVTFSGTNADGGAIENNLKINGNPLGSDKSEPLGDDTVKAEIVKVEPPKPPVPHADLWVEKKVSETDIKLGEGEKVSDHPVTYTIILHNENGTLDGTVNLTDTLGKNITLSDIKCNGETITEINGEYKVPMGESVKITATGTFTGTIDDVYTNEIKAVDESGKNIGGNKVETRFSVEKPTFMIQKSGKVLDSATGDEKTIFAPGDNVEYTITVKNTSKLKGSVTISDVLSDVNAVKWDTTDWDTLGIKLQDVKQNAWTDTKISAPTFTVELAGGEEKKITLKGTIPAEYTGDSFQNNVNDQNGNTISWGPTFAKANARFGISKNAEPKNYIPGGELKWTIDVRNEGNVPLKGVLVKDETLIELEEQGWEISGYRNGDQNTVYTAVDFGSGISVDLNSNETKQFIINAKIPSDFKGDIVNNASAEYAGEIKTAESKTPMQKYGLTKTIVDEKTAGYSLGENEEIEFEITFTNNSDEVIQDLYFNDYGSGLDIALADGTDEYKSNLADNEFAPIEIVRCDGNLPLNKNDEEITSIPCSGGSGYLAQDKNWGNAWKEGYRIDQYPNLSWARIQYCFMGIDLPVGGKLVLRYKTRLTYNADNWDDAFNQAGFTATKFVINEWNTSGALAYADPDSGADIKVKKPIKLNNSLSMTKDAVNSTIDLTSGVDKAIENGVEYKISLVPNSKDNTNYSGKEFTIEDVLPENVIFNEITGKSEDITIVGDPVYNRATGNLTIKVKSSNSLNKENKAQSYITYSCIINGLENELKKVSSEKSFTITNTAKITYDNDKMLGPDSADITFTKIPPKPGFAKSGVASLPGEFDANSADFSRAEHGFITAGDNLVWDLVIYNGNGSDEDIASLSIAGKKVTDVLPSCYELGGVIGAGKVTLADGNYKTTVEEKETGSLSELYTMNGKLDTKLIADETVKGKPVFTIPEGTPALGKNEAYVIRIWTKCKDGMETEGVITNQGYIDLETEYTQSEVAAGEPKGSELWNTANYSIVGLTTESYKEIEYVGQGHTVADKGHDDPITDNGISTKATKNFVQGMQGEDVIYTLHIKNTSPIDLEGWTIIDRLPYVGDVGLVSGYERSSAFNVAFNSKEDVTVKAGGETPKFDISYSSDKKTVLNEYSSDWSGGAGEMQWYSAPKSDTVNFRIELEDGFKVATGEEIVITFKGTVPSYVAKTGKDNIAWNSFAYSYMAPDVLGETVMVSEPAKVGVWVTEPDVDFDLTVVKELANNAKSDLSQSFYFAIFDKPSFEEGATRLSDVVEVVVDANGVKGEKVVPKVDRTALKTLNQADQLYILETDKDGNALKGYNVTYKNDKNGIGDNEITGEAADKTQTITITNEKNVGSIEVTKTVEGENLVDDTFFFALFTRDEATETYVRYADAPVKKLAYNAADGNAEMKVTFDNIPADTEFYVFETDSSGNLADNSKIPTEYISSSGVKYTVKGSDTPVTPSTPAAEAAITNTKQVTYKITVDKSLVIENVDNATGKFKVELVEYENVTKNPDDGTYSDGTEVRSEIKEIIPGTPVTFEIPTVEEGHAFRIYELYEDANGSIEVDGKKYSRITSEMAANGVETKFTYSYQNEAKKQEEKTVPLRVSYDGAGDKNKNGENHFIVLDPTYCSVGVGITNTTKNPNKITVNKTAYNVTSQGTKYISDHVFNVALFTLEKDKNTYERVSDVQTKITNDNGVLNDPITFDSLIDSATIPNGNYYVFEVEKKDGEWIPKLSGETITQNDKTFVVSYSASMVTIDGETPAEVDVTDEATEKVTLTMLKTDIEGEPLSGVKLTVTAETDIPDNVSVDGVEAVISGNTITWTTGDTAAQITGLPDGKYTLTEQIVGEDMGVYETQTHVFEIENGFFKASADNTNSAYLSLSATSLALANRSVFYVSKFEIGGKSEKSEIAGAKLTIKRTDGSGINKDVITHNNSSLTVSNDGKSLTFTSEEGKSTEIIGLPDGEYTLIEEAAPNGLEVISDWQFAIVNGKIVPKQTEEPDTEKSYVNVEKNSIIVNDAPKKTISISKYEIGLSEEIDGAKIRITPDSETYNDTESTEYKAIVKAFETLVIKQNGENVTAGLVNGTTIEFTSIAGYPTLIQGLADGTYVLEEVTPPDEYGALESTWKFTVKNGEVTASETTTDETKSHVKVDDNDKSHIIVNDKKNGPDLSISKKAMGGSEIEGAHIEFSKIEVSEADSVLTIGEETKLIDEWDSKTEPHVISADLENGYYLLRETIAPDGYTVITNVYVYIENGVPKSYYSLNEDGKTLTEATVGGANDEVAYNEENNTIVLSDKPVSVTISKRINAPDGSALIGAKLRLTIISADKTFDGVTLPDGASKPANDESGKWYVEFTSTGADVFTCLKDGEYVLSEVEVPKQAEDNTKDAYKLAKPITFKVVKGEVKVTAPEDKENYTSDGKEIYSDDNADVIMVDKSIAPLYKYTFIKKSADDKALTGAEFTLNKVDESTLMVEDTRTLTFGEKSECSFETEQKLEGYYLLEEISAPDGYICIAKVYIHFTDGKADGIFKAENGKLVKDDRTDITINGREITVKDEVSEITFNKFDITGKEELVGAELELLDEDGKPVLDTDNKEMKWKSEKGKTWTVSGLADGKYQLRETGNPVDGDGNKYNVIESNIKFEVKDGVIVKTEYTSENVKDTFDENEKEGYAVIENGNTVKICDALKPSIKINKYDVTGNKEVQGAQLTIKDSKNEVVASWKSEIGSSMEVILDDGTYTLEESAADGAAPKDKDGNEYTIINSTVEFTVKNGVITEVTGDAVKKQIDEASTEGYFYSPDTSSLNVYDVIKPKKTITFNKFDITGKEELVGAELELLDEDGKPVLDTDNK
ncbi:MAG: hypothetical protein J6B75_06450, partial [Ruminococcus sp.]|nr:hypothetical protein [Ruminococcus sp.]